MRDVRTPPPPPPGRLLAALLFAVLVALAVARPAGAQAADPRTVTFAHLTTADGLPSAKVTAVVQDGVGFIWVGTIDGLARYDGYDVREFRHVEGDPGSLATNVVTALLPARDGALWVGTSGGGLDRYDPATETFTHFRHARRDARSLPSDEVLALAEDAGGAIWVGTTAGLARFDPEDGAFLRLAHEAGSPRSLPHDEVMALWADPAGPVWVGTKGGLARLDPAAGAFTPYIDPDPAARTIGVVRPREAGGLWVGTWGAGLRVFDPRTGRFAAVPLGDDRITASVISALYQDGQGTLWVGTFGAGLYELPVGAPPVVHRAREGDAASLADDAVSAVMQDRQGVLWVGTYGGLDRFDRARGLFRLVRRVPDDPAALPANNVLSVLAGRDGTLWVGTDRGLARALDSTLTRFETTGGSSALTPAMLGNAIVNALYEDDEGTLWVGTNSGLDRRDARTRRFVHLHPGTDNNSFVTALAGGPGGRLWVGTNDEGLFLLDRQTARFTPFRPDPRRPASLTDPRVQALAVAGGRLWVGTAAGLDRLDDARGGGRFTHFEHAPGDPRGLCGAEVTALYARANGTLWVGTNGGGLCQIDAGNPERGFERWTEAAGGLPGNVIRAITEDAAGFLWISTSRGLARMDPVTGAFRPFETQAGEFNVGAAARGPGGTIYFGATGGLLAFSPGQAAAINPHPPGVVITGVRLFNEPLAPTEDGPLRRAAPVADVLRLPYDQDVVTFEFAAIHFADPRRNTYRYRLDGFDEEWREGGTQRTATYTSLSPGRYTFRVRATSADGVPSEEEATLALVVRPPWWRTRWAYLFYLLLIGGAVYAADRVQRQRVQRKERERADRAEAELRAVMAETESRALKAEAERLKAEDERKAAELARQQAEVDRARELAAKSKEIERAYTALEASLRDLRATQAQLLQQEKLASLGQLTAGIAHEIKNPLNFVNNFAELSVDLADELEEELRARTGASVEDALPELAELLDDLRENARRIHEHGRRADRIVRNMLAHSRGGAGELVRTDVNRFVDEYANLAYHGMRAKEAALNVAVRREFDADAGAADLTPQELGRVLVNLLNNAFYAVAERARREGAGYLPTVTIVTRRVETAEGPRVEIAIEDNGTGIPEDARARIFEPFFTTKPSGEGTGLGLSLAHEIVARGHGGTLGVESAEGEGTTFVIRLPAPAEGDEPRAADDGEGGAEDRPAVRREG